MITRFVIIVVLALISFSAPSFAADQPVLSPKLAVAAKSPLVQDNVAIIYAEGRGVPQDYAKAAEWFHKAAVQGDVYAQSSLGYLYTTGQGVKQDFEQAARWYYKAALQGDARSEFHLGTLYYLGMGVRKSPETAAEWFTRAAAHGDAQAKYYLQKIAYHPEATVRPAVVTEESMSEKIADEAQVAPQKGVGLVFLQGAGAAVGFESLFFWILVPLLALFAI